MSENKPVVVHANNAIFFGYLISKDGNKVKLRDARNAYYWKCSKGMLELSNTGPQKGSKIGDRADIELENVVLTQDCKPAAVEAWEKLGWGE